MPDWSYRTVLRPLLFQLPPATAQAFCLKVMGALGRSPIGPFVIDFLGHMRADPRLARTRSGLEFSSIVGLGSGIDVEAEALRALERFGFGFAVVGPVIKFARCGARAAKGGGVERRPRDESIAVLDPPDNPGAATLSARLARGPARGARLVARLASSPQASAREAADEIQMMSGLLATHVAVLAVEPGETSSGWDEAGWAQFLAAADPRRVLWLVVPPDLDPADAERRVRLARAAGVVGVFVGGAVRDPGRPGWRRMGRPAREPTLAMVRLLRRVRRRRSDDRSVGRRPRARRRPRSRRGGRRPRGDRQRTRLLGARITQTGQRGVTSRPTHAASPARTQARAHASGRRRSRGSGSSSSVSACSPAARSRW